MKMIDRHTNRPARGWRASALRLFGVVTLLVLLGGLPGAAYAHDPIEYSGNVFDLVSFEQRLNHDVPRDLPFRDETGRSVTLNTYLGDKPLVLVLSYYECETLCPMVREGLVESLRPLRFSVGKEFDVVVVSIDPEETPDIAAQTKAEVVAAYGRPGTEAGWHFLTGEHDNVDQLAEAVGFRFAYDAKLDEYAHPSGLMLLTPTGKLARYFYGIEYGTRDLRLGLVDASKNEIGSPIDQLLLLCYHYDPAVGQYSLLIMNVLRTAGLVTIVGLGALIWAMSRKQSSGAHTLG